jgi:hypothetical protein
MAINPTLAPRVSACQVCQLVAVPGDVTLRQFDEELHPLPMGAAVEYLRAVGFAGTDRQIKARALTHLRHVEKFIQHGGALAPAQDQADGISRLSAPITKAGWVDVNQSVMNTGLQASEIIAERLRSNAAAIDFKDLVAAQAQGSNAASKRAELELKGLLKRGEKIGRIAAGIDRPAE